MRDYELLYIIKPEVAEDAIDGIVEKFNEVLVKEGATVAEVDKWGKRKLAYEIDKKYREGYYVLVKFNGPSAAVDECDRLMKIDDAILRQLITKVGE